MKHGFKNNEKLFIFYLGESLVYNEYELTNLVVLKTYIFIQCYAILQLAFVISISICVKKMWANNNQFLHCNIQQ